MNEGNRRSATSDVFTQGQPNDPKEVGETGVENRRITLTSRSLLTNRAGRKAGKRSRVLTLRVGR